MNTHERKFQRKADGKLLWNFGSPFGETLSSGAAVADLIRGHWRSFAVQSHRFGWSIRPVAAVARAPRRNGLAALRGVA